MLSRYWEETRLINCCWSSLSLYSAMSRANALLPIEWRLVSFSIWVSNMVVDIRKVILLNFRLMVFYLKVKSLGILFNH